MIIYTYPIPYTYTLLQLANGYENKDIYTWLCIIKLQRKKTLPC